MISHLRLRRRFTRKLEAILKSVHLDSFKAVVRRVVSGRCGPAGCQRPMGEPVAIVQGKAREKDGIHISTCNSVAENGSVISLVGTSSSYLLITSAVRLGFT